MKSFLKKTFLLTIAIVTIVMLWNCTAKENSGSASSVEIPKLLDRSEKIQNGIEWEQVQNTFANNKSRILQDANDTEALITLAQTFVREARVTGEHGHYYPAALALLNTALKHDDLDRDTRFRMLCTMAGVELSLHNFKKAETIGLEAYALNPNNAQIHGVLVDAYVELGEYEKAVLAGDKMVNIKPDIRSYSRISYLREIHGDIDGAIEAMHMAVTAGYPGTEESAWAMQTLGELYQRYNQPEKAKKVFEAILAEREDYPFAVGALASLSFEKGDFASTEATLNEAMNIIPEVGFYVQMAELLKAEGKIPEMKTMVDEIFVMLEDDVVHGHNMNLEYAHVYLDILDDPKGAMKYVNLEMEKRPNNIDVNLLMAKVQSDLKNNDQLKNYIEKAERTNSKHPELLQLKSKMIAAL